MSDTAKPPAIVHLTPGELIVVDLAAQGYTAAEMGRRLMLSKRTVDFHLGNVYAKLGYQDDKRYCPRVRLAVEAAWRGWVGVHTL